MADETIQPETPATPSPAQPKALTDVLGSWRAAAPATESKPADPVTSAASPPVMTPEPSTAGETGIVATAEEEEAPAASVPERGACWRDQPARVHVLGIGDFEVGVWRDDLSDASLDTLRRLPGFEVAPETATMAEAVTPAKEIN